MKQNKTSRILYSVLLILLVAILSIFITQLLFVKTKAAVFLPFVLLLFGLGWHYAPLADVKKVILIFIFLYPLLPCLAGFQIADGVPVFRTQRIATILIILFLLRRQLFFKYFKNFFASNTFTYPLLFLILSLSMTAFFSYNKIGSIFGILSLVFESIILAVIVYNAFETEKDIDLLINALTASVIILCILGIYERLFEHNIFFFFGVFDPTLAFATEFNIRYGEIRIQGPFDHPIAFGAYLVASLTIVLYKFRDNIILFNIALALVALTVYFTQSRSGMIGFACVYIMYFILINHKKNFIVSFLAILIIFIPNAGTILDYYWEMDELMDSQYLQTERTRQFYFLIEYIKENVLFGYGAIEPPAHLVSDTFGMGQAHHNTIDNYYLLYAFHYGVMGLAVYLIFYISIFLKPLMVLKGTILRNNLVIAIFISIVVIAIINIVVALWSFLFIIWIYLGILSRILVNHTSKPACRQ